MKLVYLLFIASFFATSCFEIDKNANKRPDTAKRANYLNDTFKNKNINGNVFVTGKYAELSLALDKDTISGIYEFYDAWDHKIKDYTRINVFYFSGIKINDSTATIDAGWPISEKTLTGKLIISENHKLSMVMNSMPDGYADRNFTDKSGFNEELNEPKNWVQIRLIKSNKANLYDTTDISSIRKGYLEKYDAVKVSAIKDNWAKIEFYNRQINKSIFGWLKQTDFYELNMLKW